jgi:hypothetical protein
MKEVTCPACGGIIEADDLVQLIELAQEHSWVAHRYQLPPEHVAATAIARESPAFDRP